MKMIPGESDPMMATVKRRKTGQDDNPVEQPHNNPIKNRLVYEVEFVDGSSQMLAANVIADNMLSQIEDKYGM